MNFRDKALLHARRFFANRASAGQMDSDESRADVCSPRLEIRVHPCLSVVDSSNPFVRAQEQDGAHGLEDEIRQPENQVRGKFRPGGE
jgi:hypothetical protein